MKNLHTLDKPSRTHAAERDDVVAGDDQFIRDGANMPQKPPAVQRPGIMARIASIRSSFQRNRAAGTAMTHRIADLEHEVHRLQVALADMSRQEAASSHRARHDGLTALPNRALLMDRFLQAAANADRKRETVAILFFDLDQFKRVNDEFGHSVGDGVLQIVAQRIQKSIRATDTACRYGGDEFVVMLTQLKNVAVSHDHARKILRRLAQPYDVGTNTISLESSVGIGHYPRDGMSLEVVMRHADAAMYRAKNRCKPVASNAVSEQLGPAGDIGD